MRLAVKNPAPDTSLVAAYVNLAIYDATIATWAAKQTYGRKRPGDQGRPLPGASPSPIVRRTE